VTGYVPLPGETDLAANAFRDLYFDGENLLLYRDTRTQTDHVLEGVSAPEDVLDAAKAATLSYEEHYADYDDWRVESVEGPWTMTVGNLELEVWQVKYKWHAMNPANVILAGGMYITEDGWVCPGYSGSDYLCFLLDGDGNRAELYAHIVNDGTPALDSFFWDTARNLRAQGLLSYADLSGEELLEIMYFQPGSFLKGMVQASEAERQTAMAALTDYLSAGDLP